MSGPQVKQLRAADRFAVLLAIVDAHPGWGPREVADEANRQNVGWKVKL